MNYKGMPEKIIFKSNEAFFESQCKFGETAIKVGEKAIVAIVLDGHKEFGIENPVLAEDNSGQKVLLKVASDDGGFIVVAKAASNCGEQLKPNDLVLWLPLDYIDSIRSCEGMDKRFGYVGIVIAKISNEIDSRNSSFVILCDYMKKSTPSYIDKLEKIGQRLFGFIASILAFYLFIQAIVNPRAFSGLFRDIEWGDWGDVFSNHALTYLLIVFVLSLGTTIFWKEIYRSVSKYMKT